MRRPFGGVRNPCTTGQRLAKNYPSRIANPKAIRRRSKQPWERRSDGEINYLTRASCLIVPGQVGKACHAFDDHQHQGEWQHGRPSRRRICQHAERRANRSRLSCLPRHDASGGALAFVLWVVALQHAGPTRRQHHDGEPHRGGDARGRPRGRADHAQPRRRPACGVCRNLDLDDGGEARFAPAARRDDAN